MIERNENLWKYLDYVYSGPRFRVYKGEVTSENILNILRTEKTPEKIDVLSIDIDSYDYHVLNSMLSCLRPEVIVAEINERFPPQIVFKIDPETPIRYIGGSFYGMSLAASDSLLRDHGYTIVELFYNNIYAVRDDVSRIKFKKDRTLSQIYNEGYVNRINRSKYLPWNKKYEPIFYMADESIIQFFRDEFRDLNIDESFYTLTIS